MKDYKYHLHQGRLMYRTERAARDYAKAMTMGKHPHCVKCQNEGAAHDGPHVMEGQE